MGKIGAFLNVERVGHGQRDAKEAIKDSEDYTINLPIEERRAQASRCMNCGVAFCQSGIELGDSGAFVGCPLHNLIPETNDLLYKGRLEEAAKRMLLTNPFPEFTARVCPAPCERACNLGLSFEAVTINDNERAISDYAWESGLVKLTRIGELKDDSGKSCANNSARVASIIGSGPAGLTIAWELARKGWQVRIFERDAYPGGLLMYGIPNMKLPKEIVRRRINLMKEAGIEFICNTDAIAHAHDIQSSSDVVVIACGSSVARDVNVSGRELDGIFFALDYLREANLAVVDGIAPAISAEGKDVVVIGGGDTGTDCIACALRQGAKSVRQIIRAKMPPDKVDFDYWPGSPNVYSQAYGQREAEEIFGEDPRLFSMDTIAFVGSDAVEGVVIQEISYEDGMHNVEGTEIELPAQLVLIAKGFVGNEPALYDAFCVNPPMRVQQTHRLDAKGATSVGDKEYDIDEAKIFVVGDAYLGSSLVVNAMADALSCAQEIEQLYSD